MKHRNFPHGRVDAHIQRHKETVEKDVPGTEPPPPSEPEDQKDLFTHSDTAPTDPFPGQMYFNTDNGHMFIWIKGHGGDYSWDKLA